MQALLDNEWVCWPTAVFIGLMATLVLLSLVPRLDQPVIQPPVKVIALNYFKWQPTPPAPINTVQPESKPSAPANPAKPNIQPKPIQKPVIIETPTRTEPTPEPEPVIRATPESERVESTPPEPGETLPLPVALAELTAMPRFLHKEAPDYPPLMRAAGREATVKLTVLIDAKGTIRDIQVKQSGGPEFDAAAVAAIKNSSFAPGEIDNNPVTVLLTVPVKFKLR